jgi:hypothetical protein
MKINTAKEYREKHESTRYLRSKNPPRRGGRVFGDLLLFCNYPETFNKFLQSFILIFFSNLDKT